MFPPGRQAQNLIGSLTSLWPLMHNTLTAASPFVWTTAMIVLLGEEEGQVAPGASWTSCEGVRDKWRERCWERARLCEEMRVWAQLRHPPFRDSLTSLPAIIFSVALTHISLSYAHIRTRTLVFLILVLFSFLSSPVLNLSAAFTESRDTLCCWTTCKASIPFILSGFGVHQKQRLFNSAASCCRSQQRTEWLSVEAHAALYLSLLPESSLRFDVEKEGARVILWGLYISPLRLPEIHQHIKEAMYGNSSVWLR